MKQTLRLLARFIWMSLLLSLLVSSLAVLYRYVIGYDPTRASEPDIVLQFVIALRNGLYVSVCISAAISLFVILRSTSKPFAPLIVLALLWTGIFVTAGALLPGPVDDDLPLPTIPENRFIRLDGISVFTPQSEGPELGPVVLHEPGANPGMSLHQEAVVDLTAPSLIVLGSRELSLEPDAVRASYPVMVTPPDRLRPLLRDVQTLNGTLLAGDRAAILVSVALGLLLLSCWTLARLTRWPLFNAILVFLCLRGALWLHWAVLEGDLGRLVASAVDPSQFTLVFSGALGFVALVLLVTLFLLQPLSSWKREIGDE